MKKIISMLLVFALLLVSMPLGVFADTLADELTVTVEALDPPEANRMKLNVLGANFTDTARYYRIVETTPSAIYLYTNLTAEIDGDAGWISFPTTGVTVDTINGYYIEAIRVSTQENETKGNVLAWGSSGIIHDGVLTDLEKITINKEAVELGLVNISVSNSTEYVVFFEEVSNLLIHDSTVVSTLFDKQDATIENAGLLKVEFNLGINSENSGNIYFERIIPKLSDTTTYDDIVSEVGDLVETKYTAESWVSYAAAINLTELTLTSSNTQAEIDAEVVKIQTALDLLVLKPTTGITWGDNITESISGDTLTLSGSGAMSDFGHLDNMNKLSGVGITNVVIGEGITNIGAQSLRNNDLTSVVIPSTVETIGANAFSSNKLTHVVIPNNVTHINGYAFSDNLITDLTLSESLTTLGTAAFVQNKLTSLVLPNSLTTIGDMAFSYNVIETVIIPNSIVTLGSSAFSNNKLTSVTMPNGLVIIDAGVFGDNLLTSITIPESVTSIGVNAFARNSLTTVTIPAGVEELGFGVFRDNASIISITMEREDTIVGNSLLELSNNNFQTAYISGGAGTYTGTQTGIWTKVIAPDTTDTTAYDTKVLEVSNLVETDYTTESWVSYTTAINLTDLTLTSSNTQEELDNEVIKIQEALDFLVGKVSVTGVSIPEGDQSIVEGTAYQLTTIISPSNATDTSVTWLSSNANVATVHSSGLVTGVSVGTAYIGAFAQDGNQSATIQITVTNPPVVSVTGVTLQEDNQSIVEGTTLQLTAVISPSNATNQTIDWLSSNATVATVNSSGLVTGVSEGVTMVRALTQDGNYSATRQITVTNPPYQTIDIMNIQGITPPVTGETPVTTITSNDQYTGTVSWTPNHSTFEADRNYQPIVQLTPKAGYTLIGVGVNVFTIEGYSGTPINAEDSGAISALYPKTGPETVSVTGVSIIPENSLSIKENTAFQLIAVVTPINATNKSVTWTSNDATVATVNSSGLVTGVSEGVTMVGALTQDGGYSATRQITVTAAPPPVAPVAHNTATTIAEGSTAIGAVTAEGNSLTYNLEAGSQHGTLTFNADGSFTYMAHRQPTVGFVGNDSFTFSARDSANQDSNIATVSITIAPVNDAPVATSKSITTTIGDETTGNVSATDIDGDALTYALVVGPTYGTLTFNSDGSYSYMATDNTQVSDSFVFKANDGLLDSGNATVTITLVVSDAEKLAIDRDAVLVALDAMVVTNELDSQEFIDVANAVITNGSTIILDYGLTEATTEATGSIIGTLRLTINAESVVLPINKTIAKLPDVTAPILTAGVVNRTSHTEATVKFTSNKAGSYYYTVVDEGAPAPINTSGLGIACTKEETTITNPIGLSEGAKDIHIIVRDNAGNVSEIIKIGIPAYTPPSSGGSTGGSNSGGSSNDPVIQPVTPTPKNEPVIIVVNGEKQNAGKETKTSENGQSIVTITVNNKTVEDKVDEAIKNNKTGATNSIQVPVTDTTSDVAKVELTGDMIKKLEDNNFNISVKRDAVEYVIPAEEFAISSTAKNLDVLESNLVDIKLEVQISTLDALVVKKFNDIAKANGSELVFPPVSFQVVAKTTKADGTTGQVVISKFNNYVQRVMEIPESVDPQTVTTGVVFNQDGTYSHVPTTVFEKDGKWFASLNSLTNSNYSLIWNEVIVESVENHWSKETVNDLASRLIIFNPENFEPNKAITRADFAEYLVRALGVYREDSIYESKFKDVTSSGDRALSILIASEYGIVSGYTDGTFKPDALITREEAMTMYQRAMKMTKLTGSDLNRYQNYKDFSSVSNWAETSVKEVLSANVFNGTSRNTISPKENITYAEAAQAIKNLLVESKLIND